MSAPTSPLVYIDTSAYLGVILGEASAKWLHPLTAGETLCSSTLLLAEAERNLVHMSRAKVLAPEKFTELSAKLKDDRQRIVLRDVTPDLCLDGRFPAVHTPRSSDLIHLRTALWFMERYELSGFLTMDKGQRLAAGEMGLRILSQ